MAMDDTTRTLNMEEKLLGFRGQFTILRDFSTKVVAAVDGLVQKDHRLLNLAREKKKKLNDFWPKYVRWWKKCES